MHPTIQTAADADATRIVNAWQEDEEDEAGVIDETLLRMSFSCVSVVHAILRVVHCVHIELVFTVSHHMCAEARANIIEHDIPLRIRADGMIPMGRPGPGCMW